MSTLTVLNAARSLLTPLGYPVHLGDTLRTGVDGALVIPDASAQFVIHALTDTPDHQWATVRYGTVRVQVDAFSTIDGEALAMLASAQAALVAQKFIPLVRVGLGRDGNRTGYAQRFERNA